MSQVHLACGLPFCQKPDQAQTNFSIGLRITAIALGTLAVSLNALIALNIFGLSHLGNTMGWTAGAVGASLILVGMAIKCVRENSNAHQEKGSQSTITQKASIGREKQSDISNLKDGRVIKKEVSKIISKPPKDLLSELPQWLSPYVTNSPYLQLEKDSVDFKDFESTVAPVVLFRAGSNVGIHMRLSVKHNPVVIVPPYAPQATAITEQGKLEISSKDPFVLQVIVWPQKTIWSDQWILTSNPQRIEHRNFPFDTSTILGDGSFTSSRTQLFEEETLVQFLDTEKQDALEKGYGHDLGWLLLRLFNEKSVEIREKRQDCIYHCFDDPAVGYWKSLSRNSHPLLH